MRRLVRRTCLGLALAGTAGCASSPVETKSQFDRSIDFGTYRTYMRAETPGVRSSVVRDRLESDVDKQLQAKGLIRKEQGADLWVVLRPKLQKEYRDDPRDLPWNAGWGYAGAAGSPIAFAKEIPVGTLVVDVVDTAHGKLVWRGFATSELDSEEAAEKNLKLLDDAVRLMFREFPPKK